MYVAALCPIEDEYLVRVDWNGSTLAAQSSDRSQRRLRLWHWNGERAETILTEADDAWVRFHRDYVPLDQRG